MMSPCNEIYILTLVSQLLVGMGDSDKKNRYLRIDTFE